MVGKQSCSLRTITTCSGPVSQVASEPLPKKYRGIFGDKQEQVLPTGHSDFTKLLLKLFPGKNLVIIFALICPRPF